MVLYPKESPINSQTERILDNTLTVGTLIDMLSEHDPNLPVLISYTSGDYWKTQVCEEINQPEVLNVEYTEYHRKLKLDIGENQDEDKACDSKPKALILRS